MLYKNLKKNGVPDPWISGMRSVYKRTWCHNQLLYHKMVKMVSAFAESGIDTMILKGMSLSLVYYQDLGVRPMGDFDLFVQSNRVSEAMELLKKLGWIYRTGDPKSHLPYRHSISYSDQSDNIVDIHWHALYQCCSAESDDDFWQMAEKVNLGDATTLTLNPTDMLFHLCIHGLLWSPEPLIHWFADAFTVFQMKKSEISWDRLVAHATKRKLTKTLLNALTYLGQALDAPIPPTFLNKLSEVQITKTEQFEYSLRTQSRKEKLIGGFPLYMIHYFRLMSIRPFWSNISGLPKYLQYVFKLERLSQVPAELLIRCLRRIARVLGLSKSQTSKKLFF